MNKPWWMGCMEGFHGIEINWAAYTRCLILKFNAVSLGLLLLYKFIVHFLISFSLPIIISIEYLCIPCIHVYILPYATEMPQRQPFVTCQYLAYLIASFGVSWQNASSSDSDLQEIPVTEEKEAWEIIREWCNSFQHVKKLYARKCALGPNFVSNVEYAVLPFDE